MDKNKPRIIIWNFDAEKSIYAIPRKDNPEITMKLPLKMWELVKRSLKDEEALQTIMFNSLVDSGFPYSTSDLALSSVLNDMVTLLDEHEITNDVIGWIAHDSVVKLLHDEIELTVEDILHVSEETREKIWKLKEELRKEYKKTFVEKANKMVSDFFKK